MDTLKDTANFVSDKVQGAAHGVSKEANKNIAKDSDQPPSTRAEAGVGAVQDKAHEHAKEASAEVNKQAATN